MKIGAAGFIMPFMFVYQPALLMIGTWPEIILAFGTASVGIALLRRRPARLFRHGVPSWQRALLVAGGMCLVVPGVGNDHHRRLHCAGFVIAVQWPSASQPPCGQSPKPSSKPQ